MIDIIYELRARISNYSLLRHILSPTRLIQTPLPRTRHMLHIHPIRHRALAAIILQKTIPAPILNRRVQIRIIRHGAAGRIVLRRVPGVALVQAGGEGVDGEVAEIGHGDVVGNGVVGGAGGGVLRVAVLDVGD